MSIFHPVHIQCAACGHTNTVQRTASVNADRRPDLRAAILDGSFQQETCGQCGVTLRIPPYLTYLDVARKQWFMVESADKIEDFEALEDSARSTWERGFGSRGTPFAQELAQGMRCRLVLGWPALREKLIADDLGLDDLSLELCKLGLLRDMPSPPLADQTELRLIEGNAQTLVMVWRELATEQAVQAFEVPRSRYDEVVERADDWAEMRAKFDGALLVDWRRLMFATAQA